MNQEADHAVWKSGKLIAQVVWFVAFVGVLVLLALMYRRLDGIEDSLQYSPPSPDMYVSRESLPHEPLAGGTFYVPTYSHIYFEGGQPFLLESTLSIRNTDPTRAITITSARYLDTGGNVVQEFLEQPVRLGPMATTEFLVTQGDTRGGSGANFLVDWIAEEPVAEPVIEAVMAGVSGEHSVALVRAGWTIRRSE
jgi:hypothetical protein